MIYNITRSVPTNHHLTLESSRAFLAFSSLQAGHLCLGHGLLLNGALQMSLNKTLQVNRCGSQDAISLIDTNITGLTEQLGSRDAVVSKI